MGKIIKSIKIFFKILFIALGALLIIGVIGFFFYSEKFDLGEGYWYNEGLYDIVTPVGIRDIPPHVVNFNFDKSYIIAKQNPMGHKPEWLYYEEYKGDSVIFHYDWYVFDQGLDYDYYWIIDKRCDKVLGPYTYKVFEDRCRKMGIKLKLDPKDDHYPSYVPK